MKELTRFNYEGTELRTVLIDGEPWFVLGDLCKALGFARGASQVADRLRKGVRRSYPLPTAGGLQQVTIVSEAGMYAVILRSDKPSAVAFQDWLTGTVLPEIRRTGSFNAADAPAVLTEDEIVHRALQITVRKVKELESKIADDAPKVAAFDLFLDGDGTYPMGVVAKALGRSRTKLFADLRNAGVLIAKGGMRNTPYQRYMHHFVVQPQAYTRPDDTVGTTYTTRVQPSGLGFIARKLGLEHLLELDAVVSA